MEDNSVAEQKEVIETIWCEELCGSLRCCLVQQGFFNLIVTLKKYGRLNRIQNF